MDEKYKKITVKKVMLAIRWLASRCDGAVASDGKGFSGTDAALGHALDGKEVWCAGEINAAIGLLVKYKKQLDSGHVDLGDINSLRAHIKDEVGNQERLKKRDVVTGGITVESGRIALKATFNEALRQEERELIGAKWDAVKVQWTCDLCAENAQSAEELAERFGLTLKKSPGWESLLPVRKVHVVENRLIVEGVQAWKIIESFPKLFNAKDGQSLWSIELVNSITVAIPLRSWVIQEALLWLAGMAEGDQDYRRIAWARDEVVRFLEDAYQGARQDERQGLTRAAAITLDSEKEAVLRAQLPESVTKRLLPHQWRAVQAIIDFRQIVLADQQGLGKTIEILAALEASQSFPAIIIAPANALLNWRDEATSWLPHRKIAVLGGGVGKRDAGGDLSTAELVIINFESFEKHSTDLAARHPKALIADEAQYLKTYNSKRTLAVKNFCKNSGVTRIVASTGTPVMNRPSELLTLITLLPDLLNELGGFNFFAKRYCGAIMRRIFGDDKFLDLTGATNLGELANRLRETGRFIRREKSAVLTALPAKKYARVAVEICNRLEYTQVVEDFSAWLKSNSWKDRNRRKKTETDLDDETTAMAATARFLGWSDEEADQLAFASSDLQHEALRRMVALRQLAGVGKIQAAVDWIQANVKDEKLLVFAYHIEVQQALIRALSDEGVSPLSITGDMTQKARRESILRFQSDESARVIVCSLKAAQTAITLTAARKVLFVELDWTPAALEQGEDRVHRIGQTRQVEITYLHAVATLDERMSELLERKKAIISTVGAGGAVYGYRADGTPRKQAPGPGRHRLDAEIRKANKRASSASWQERNKEYMREYMSRRRRDLKITQAKQTIADFQALEKHGWRGMVERMRAHSYYYQEDYDRELQQARTKAESARKVLQRFEVA